MLGDICCDASSVMSKDNVGGTKKSVDNSIHCLVYIRCSNVISVLTALMSHKPPRCAEHVWGRIQRLKDPCASGKANIFPNSTVRCTKPDRVPSMKQVI